MDPRASAGAFRLVAVHNFARRTYDELSLRKQDLVEVLETDAGFSDGWYMGRNLSTGKTGLFPVVYTAPVAAATATEQVHHNTNGDRHHRRSHRSTNSNSHALPQQQQQQQQPQQQSPAPTESSVHTAAQHTSVYDEIEQALSTLAPSATASAADIPHTGTPPVVATPTIITTTAPDSLPASPAKGLGPSPVPTYAQTPSTPVSWMTNDVAQWTPADVSRYLSDLSFDPDVCAKFVEHKITGNILIELELAHLKELDINSFGTRFELNKAIENLRNRPKHAVENANAVSTSAASPFGPSSQSQYKHQSVQPLEPDFTRSRLAFHESLHSRQRSRSLELHDEERDDLHLHLPVSSGVQPTPAAMAPAEAWATLSTSPMSPPTVSPLVPGARSGATSSDTATSRRSTYDDENDDVDDMVQDTLDELLRAQQTSSLASSPSSRSFDPSQLLASPMHNRQISTSTTGTQSSYNLTTADDASMHTPSRYRGLRRSSPAGRNTVDAAIVPSRDLYPEDTMVPPPRSPTSNGTAYHPPNARSASNNAAFLSMIPSGLGITSTPPPPSSMGPPNGKLDSQALKSRSNTTTQTSPKRFYTDPVAHSTVTISLPKSMTDGLAMRSLSTSTTNNSSVSTNNISAPFRPKRLTKENTSAFTEGRLRVTPAQSAATADHSGWMSKRGSASVAMWKNRYFVLHGTRLSYFGSALDDKEKGLIDITAHKVIPVRGGGSGPGSSGGSEDKLVALHAASTGAGRYCFKLVPPAPGARKGVTFTAPKTHYFAVDTREEMQSWMRALMRSTIDRDDSVAVVSTCSTPTVSLAKAQEMSLRARAIRAEELGMSLPELVNMSPGDVSGSATTTATTTSAGADSSSVSTPELSKEGSSQSFSDQRIPESPIDPGGIMRFDALSIDGK
ncbi:uncharacterized protein V1518DRAFT_454483 [Limtongia smithiae]|uniref:uncharacterized protein n=1 Tax=Limtongia smithiae TaxID=1125753 RepID=UPI0034CE4D89